MRLIIRLALNVFALLVVEYLVPGFVLTDYRAAIVAAIVIGIINTVIKPIVKLITLPLTIVTFGLFSIVINVFLLWGASLAVPGFDIANLTVAFIASIVLTLVSWFLNKLAD